MPTYVAEAVEIITDDGTGIPTTYSNTALGLASDGHFYLITDRFGLSGTPEVTGGTTRTVWYEKILSRDYGAFTISRNCDFVETGAMESVSGFSFSIENTSAWWSTLKTNGVYLAGRTVKYYRVTASSTDGPFNFELRWTGVIDDQPYNELTESIHCVDNSKDIYKSVPNVQVNTVNFPSAKQDSLDKNIPIVLGRVSYSPLVNVSTAGVKTALCYISGISYTIAAAYYYVEASNTYGLRLYTSGVSFSANDSRLVGKYLNVVAVGAERLILIISSTASVFYTDGYGTVVMLAEPLVGFTDPTNSWQNTTTPATDAVWYFEVSDNTPNLIASNKPIYSINTNPQLRPLLFTYDTSIKDYSDVSHLNISSSITNINKTGYPGFNVVSATADNSGSLYSYFGLTPEYISQVTNNFATSDIPAIGTNAPYLIDKSNSTYYTLTKHITLGNDGQLVFNMRLPKENVLKTNSAVYVCLDLSHYFAEASRQITIKISAYAIDIYGRKISTAVSNETVFSGGPGTSPETLRILPRNYMGQTGSDSSFFKYRDSLDVSAIISDSKKLTAYNLIQVKIDFLCDIGGNYTLKLEQIGLVGKRSVNVTGEDLYGTIIGETFGTGWQSRKTLTNPIYLLTDAYEHLLRNYDTPYSIWVAGKTYAIGDKIRATADNGHIFVCTVAGTSHASVEPTWTTTALATYTDNTITWKEFKTIPINTTSFDSLNAQRSDWFIGRTLIDKKDSEEYYKELCQQGFIVSLIGSDGKVKVKAWRENVTPTVTFNSTNILQGTLGDMTYTPIRKMYNDFVIKYDFNYGSNKFNKQLSITNIDKPAFPAITDRVNPGTSLGSFSIISYATTTAGLYILAITTSADHGMETGVDRVDLVGNTHGYDFSNSGAYGGISVASSTEFIVYAYIVPTTSPTTTGILSKASTSVLKWPSFVGGIASYATAKILWDACHASYLVTKRISPLPKSLGECTWFIDPAAKDPSGEYVWVTNGVLDLNVGDNHPAMYYLQNLVNWTAWQKKQITIEVADTSTYSALEIGDPVYFTDAKLSNGTTLLGWIHEKTQLPRSDSAIERFRFGITFQPEGYTATLDSLILDENGATNIIDENSATNIYDENGA